MKARTAVLLPCYNEAVTIGQVVADFRAALPDAVVYVFDNASDDDTAAKARAAGAVIVPSPRRGKGNVVRHMFRTVDADLYVMADGDGTYPAHAAPELIRALEQTDADMVVGTRLQHSAPKSFRSLHGLGNRVISGLISSLFSASLTDVLSGYRVFRRHFVRTLYLRSSGFEIETEITLQALVKERDILEVPVPYGARPEGSHSKLRTWSDGALVLKSILLIFRDYKPLAFFSCVAGVCFVLGLLAGWLPVKDYIETRFVSHVPLALLAAALEVLAVLFQGIGLILNAIKRFHQENQEMMSAILKRFDQDHEGP
ncbi:MAG TPA: glycosyltransferase [Candidatus Krumholzibacteria bacterium]|nr:glycosyltransferase [Candidatus Krumholzibacteria bacterium]